MTSGYVRFVNPLEVLNRMPVFNQPPESMFAFVIVAGKRARQLMTGAIPLVSNPHSTKSTRVAMEELNAGLLEYEMPERPEDAAEKEAKRRKE
jgi:DNA-directed RNA polymerase omega subunit